MTGNEIFSDAGHIFLSASIARRKIIDARSLPQAIRECFTR
jgi:hypothetical protein